MNILPDKNDPNRFEVESSSRKGEFHIVTLDRRLCDCPHFLYRMRAVGSVCKHIAAVEEYAAKHGIADGGAGSKGKAKKGKKKEADFDKIIDYVKKKGEVESIALIEKFGDDAVEHLLKSGELFEENGLIKVMS